ncbi:MAG: hypothetical protein IJ825_11000 [Oscillospiraceae bacterium]|nr:hypothetical protein [Oscillospiraceae bacterium]
MGADQQDIIQNLELVALVLEAFRKHGFELRYVGDECDTETEADEDS